MSSFPFSLPQIAAAKEGIALAHGEATNTQAHLARLQKVRAAKLTQLEAVHFLIEENNPVVIIRGESSEVTLHLGAATADLYQVIRDALYERLGALEVEIIQAHIAVEDDTREMAENPSDRLAYAAAIVQLCTAAPEEPVANSTPPVPIPATSLTTPIRQAPQRTTTICNTAVGSDSNPANRAAAAA